MPNNQHFSRAVSNPTLDQQIAGARSSAEIAELCRNAFPEYRAVTRDGELAVSDSQAAPMPETPAAPSGTSQFYEVLYPHENDRFEISADSWEELEEKKRKIFAMYQR